MTPSKAHQVPDRRTSGLGYFAARTKPSDRVAGVTGSEAAGKSAPVRELPDLMSAAGVAAAWHIGSTPGMRLMFVHDKNLTQISPLDTLGWMVAG